jgi:hypothetical protein
MRFALIVYLLQQLPTRVSRQSPGEGTTLYPLPALSPIAGFPRRISGSQSATGGRVLVAAQRGLSQSTQSFQPPIFAGRQDQAQGDTDYQEEDGVDFGFIAGENLAFVIRFVFHG